MAISSDLFTAILAMDAYNRGYNSGLGDAANGLGGIGSQIGNAIVSSDTRILGTNVAQAASFFAQAYSWNGQTVISYRGTDFFGESPVSPFDGDVWNGWGVGAGSPYGTQARLALEFYQTVAGGSTVDPRTANIALTGHSLGAGLAGLAGGSLHGHRFCGDSLRQRLLGLSEPGQDDRHPQAAFRAVREDDFAAM